MKLIKTWWKFALLMLLILIMLCAIIKVQCTYSIFVNILCVFGITLPTGALSVFAYKLFKNTLNEWNNWCCNNRDINIIYKIILNLTNLKQNNHI